MRRQRQFPPQTPAQRQAKCRAIKKGTWNAIPALPDNWRELPQYAHLLPGPGAKPAAALPAPAKKELPAPAKKELPAPASGTSIQKAFSPNATALALSDADGARAGAADAMRLSLPPAVAARLQSLLDRHRSGKTLTATERGEAEGLLDIAEFFVVQRMRNRLVA